VEAEDIEYVLFGFDEDEGVEKIEVDDIGWFE
jgi:hypothetical protein